MTQISLTDAESQRPDSQGNNADVIISSLFSAGIRHIFLVPGKLIYPLINALSISGIKGIMGAHETACGFMADGYARASRKFGVCLGISGPGTMNFVPAMAAAQADKIPVLYLAGGVSTCQEAQGAFQDGSNGGLDELTIVKPLMNTATELKNPVILRHELRRTLGYMNMQRKGQAYLSIPVNIQKQRHVDVQAERDKKKSICREIPIDVVALDTVINDYLLKKCNVAILTGNRVNNSQDAALLRAVAETYSIPVATTLSGKGGFPEEHSLALGLYGFAGHTRAVDILHSDNTDVLLVLGCDLSQRDSFNWTPKLHGKKTLILIDEDFGKSCLHYQPDLQIFSNLNGTLQYFLQRCEKTSSKLLTAKRSRSRWITRCQMIPLELERLAKVSRKTLEESGLYPGDVARRLRALMPADTNVVVDSGAHRIFMAHHWRAKGGGDYHTSSELAPMGWAICAGIGIKLASPEKPCLVVTGDGCMLMHGIEIQTAARYQLPVIFVVMNNHAHGAIHIDTLQKRGISQEYTTLSPHDWTGFARSLGMTAYRVRALNELDEAINNATSEARPCVIEIIVGNHATPNDYYVKSITEYEQRIGNLQRLENK